MDNEYCSHYCEMKRSEIRRGLGCPQQAKRDASGGEAVIGISEKDIPIHCLPVLSENSYNIGYRNKIFIETSRKTPCNHKDKVEKCSDKNLPIPEDGVCPEIPDSEKVPIKMDLSHKLRESNKPILY